MKPKAWSNVQIAEFTGHHRNTIAKVLKVPVDLPPKKRERASSIDVFQVPFHGRLDQPLPAIGPQ